MTIVHVALAAGGVYGGAIAATCSSYGHGFFMDLAAVSSAAVTGWDPGQFLKLLLLIVDRLKENNQNRMMK